MSDSVSIFCNLANSRKKLSDIDFAIMYNNCKNEDLKVSAPNYFIKNFEFSLITTNIHPEVSVKEIMNIIEKDLESGVKSRVIGLMNDSEICYNRMVERARGSETSYKKIDIERNCFAYQQLYEMIQNPDYQEIRLFDLGKLLQYKFIIFERLIQIQWINLPDNLPGQRICAVLTDLLFLLYWHL